MTYYNDINIFVTVENLYEPLHKPLLLGYTDIIKSFIYTHTHTCTHV